jgi:hypothetical protein
MSLLTAITDYLNNPNPNQWQNNTLTIHGGPPRNTVRTLRQGQEVLLDQTTLTLTRNAQNQYSARLSGGTYNNVTCNNLDPVLLAAEISENSYVGNYTAMWYNDRFQQFYRVKARNFEVLQDGREVTAVNFYLSSPCMMCGICLPIHNMHIDHQRPQQGGGLQSILKTMRALGFTIGRPKGQKGQLHNIVDRPRVWTGLMHMQAGGDNDNLNNRRDRYTLNDEGTIYYSLFVAAGGRNSLESECMNSFYNLRPLCVSCNTSLGARGLRTL